MNGMRILLFLPLVAVFAQTRSFEVATIKPTITDTVGLPAGFPATLEMTARMRGGPGTKNPERIDYLGVTLKPLLMRAYGLKPEQVAGPGWISTEKYDLVAKLPPEATAEQLRLMLQPLLAERFKIQMHRETRSIPVYFLTIAKDGPKLKPPEPEPQYASVEERRAALQKSLEVARAKMDALTAAGDLAPRSNFNSRNATMKDVVEMLNRNADRPAVDKTGLTGTYSISLEWIPDNKLSQARNSSGLSLPAALEEQMGLKLQPGNNETSILVIDRAEKSPGEN